MAPSGRAARPTLKVAKDASSAEPGSIAGKNNLGNTVAATTPYNVKSNHSKAVPTVAAVTARFAMERDELFESFPILITSAVQDARRYKHQYCLLLVIVRHTKSYSLSF
jgi:hypothetical protein